MLLHTGDYILNHLECDVIVPKGTKDNEKVFVMSFTKYHSKKLLRQYAGKITFSCSETVQIFLKEISLHVCTKNQKSETAKQLLDQKIGQNLRNF